MSLAGEHPRLVFVENPERRVDTGLNGCAFSRRWQKPWIVEIQAPSSSRARSCRSSSASRLRIRPRSSPAARSV